MSSAPTRRHLRPVDDTSSAVLHGMHPLRGYPVTWRLTPRQTTPGAPPTFLVEQADGEIEDELTWLYVERVRSVMTAEQVRDLVHRVTGL